MPKLSINLTDDEHQKLKSNAAMKGQSIRDFVLSQTLGQETLSDEMSAEQAMEALKIALEPRIEQARNGDFAERSLEDIRKLARQQSGLD